MEPGQAQQQYFSFLDDEEGEGIYSNLVKDMVSNGKRRLLVNVNDLKRRIPDRAKSLSQMADDEISVFSKSLYEYVASHFGVGSLYGDSYSVGFEGCFGDRYVSPRMITSQFIGSVLCVDGIVTRISSVRPHCTSTVHFCPGTGKVIDQKYTDIFSNIFGSSSNFYPTKDEAGNLLETEYGLSCYKDFQTITLQETPDNSPIGQLPRSVDISCAEDLSDTCKPGDRVKVVASFRCIPSNSNGYTSGSFSITLIANNIVQLKKDADPEISRDELNSCKKLACDSNIFELLSNSLAPSIHGHNYVKKAILCLLLGGSEKKLLNGSRLRGDINILLIGDPSVAKSQLLRYVLLIAPRAISATGRGSSGVGLTAAVSYDQETGERKLEAGAMVLADRGVVCIDEFDKMNDADRTAIHEVMEQGRVTISKAGMHARLNARCSVLAAANPVYGKYDQEKTPMQNIGLQDSLLSRFDLLFVMQDNVNKVSDRLIADHVVRMHRFRDQAENEGEVSSTRVEEHDKYFFSSVMSQENKASAVYEKRNSFLLQSHPVHSERVLSINFMRKYIHIARCLSPKLTERACEIICNEYSRLRTQEIVESIVVRTQPVTVRTLETLIRIATAHAKARLSNVITTRDAELAIELVRISTSKSVTETRKRKSSVSNTGDRLSTREETSISENLPSRSKRQKKNKHEFNDRDDHCSKETTLHCSSRCDEESTTVEDSIVSPEKSKQISMSRLETFKTFLLKCFRGSREQSLPRNTLVRLINASALEKFSDQEVDVALQIMTRENQIMLSDGTVFLI